MNKARVDFLKEGPELDYWVLRTKNFRDIVIDREGEGEPLLVWRKDFSCSFGPLKWGFIGLMIANWKECRWARIKDGYFVVETVDKSGYLITGGSRKLIDAYKKCIVKIEYGQTVPGYNAKYQRSEQ